MNIRHILILALFSIQLPASAAEPIAACHWLLTVQECSDHLNHLALLQPGAARDEYLAEFERIRKDREAACDCTRIASNRFPRKLALKF